MIDWTRLDDLRGEMSDADLGEVIDLFLEEADETVARLGADLASGDLGAALHFLKGSALNLGFADLARLCDQAEQRPDAAQIPALVATYAASRAAFLKGLAARMAA